MANLTSKELSTIEDRLAVEQVMIAKYKMFAQTCTDPQLKTRCEQIASKHQNHYTRLVGYLN